MFSKVIDIVGVYELKLSKSNSIPYNAVKPHQVEALTKAKHEGLFHKISDALPIFGGNKHMRFTAKKPFDCMFLHCPAYVAICFYQPRKKKEIYLIDIDRFIETRDHDTRKSLTKELADKISTYCLNLN